MHWMGTSRMTGCTGSGFVVVLENEGNLRAEHHIGRLPIFLVFLQQLPVNFSIHCIWLDAEDNCTSPCAVCLHNLLTLSATLDTNVMSIAICFGMIIILASDAVYYYIGFVL